MTKTSKINHIFAVALLASASNIAAVQAGDKKELPPEATAEQAQASFWDMPLLAEPYITASPVKRGDGIKVGKLGIDGGQKDAVIKVAKELEDGKDGGYDSFLVAHKGKLLMEAYYDRGRINLAHPQASATKGYTTLILGRAIQLGYLTMADLEKPLIDFLKDLDRSKLVDGADKITLHKAMTMRSGIRLSEEKRREMEATPEAVKGQQLVQAWLETTPAITEASQSYLYSFDPDLVMQVIDAVVPGSAQDFIKTELLDKMGITNYAWQDDVTGLPEAGWRVSMTSRDMLKWGSLVANGGKWNGEQLIPVAYIKKATSPLVNPGADWQPDNYRYGYYWYHVPVTAGDKTYDTTFAWGGWGQYVVVVPELELTMAITGEAAEDKIMEKVSTTIIPAFAD